MLLEIPAARRCPDTILSWPIFRESLQLEPLNGLILKDQGPSVPHFPADPKLDPTHIVDFVDCFLKHVHIKNPVLSITFLRLAQLI